MLTEEMNIMAIKALLFVFSVCVCMCVHSIVQDFIPFSMTLIP